MKSRLSFPRKRELLAHGMFWTGASSLLSRLPGQNSLLVLNYHRIGNADEDLFDPGIFSATAEQFNKQITYLKHHFSLVTLEEALAFIEGTNKEKARRCRVLITLDDGYLDNYKIAFPILCSHGVQGVFFLVTSMVDSCQIPWWDHIAYLMKTARRRRFSLSYPSDLAVNIDKSGLAESVQAVLQSFKRPTNTSPERFIRELTAETQGDDPPKTQRRFLNWEEAREMSRAGMAIGSHSHSHHVLSQLNPEQLFEELSISQTILKQEIGVQANVLAYPVGSKSSFTDDTQSKLRASGYRGAFSHYGGVNLQGVCSLYDIKRNKVFGQSWPRFHVQSAVCGLTGAYWP